VRNIQKFGAFVELAEGVEGLVHISDLVGDRRLNHPSEVLKQDQRVRAVVLEVDPEKKRIKLGMKQIEPDSTDEYLGEHKVGDEVMGRVVRIEGDAARVELGEGVIGTCRSAGGQRPAATSTFGAQLAAAWKQEGPAADAAGSAPAFQVGQVRSFRITAIDPDSKRIELGTAG
jgi:small subunit ribosomal protein S1